MAFGDFYTICQQASVPLCSVVGAITQIAGSHGIEADCYARNIELANTIIFQGAASFMHIVALIMTVIMILHVRSKFTAVGMFLNIHSNTRVDDVDTHVTDDTINRAQRDHHLLLHIHAINISIPHS